MSEPVKPTGQSKSTIKRVNARSLKRGQRQRTMNQINRDDGEDVTTRVPIKGTKKRT